MQKCLISIWGTVDAQLPRVSLPFTAERNWLGWQAWLPSLTFGPLGLVSRAWEMLPHGEISPALNKHGVLGEEKIVLSIAHTYSAFKSRSLRKLRGVRRNGVSELERGGEGSRPGAGSRSTQPHPGPRTRTWLSALLSRS